MKRHPRIALIDDSNTIRLIVSRMLSNRGFQALATESFELALTQFSKMAIDVVITDIFMPGMGGIEGIMRLRKKWPNVKVIAISAGHGGTCSDKALQAASKIGADVVLPKPFTEDQLAAALASVGVSPVSA